MFDLISYWKLHLQKMFYQFSKVIIASTILFTFHNEVNANARTPSQALPDFFRNYDQKDFYQLKARQKIIPKTPDLDINYEYYYIILILNMISKIVSIALTIALVSANKINITASDFTQSTFDNKVDHYDYYRNITYE